VVPRFGYSPYEIVFGVKPYSSFNNTLLETPNFPSNVNRYLGQIKDRMFIVRETVRSNQTAANARTATRYNAKSQTKVPIFKTSDRVCLYSLNVKGKKLTNKITPKYKGLFLIVQSNPAY